MKRRLLCAALAACLLLSGCSQTPAKVKEIASEGTVPTTKETTTASSVDATTTTTEAAAETVETTTAAETTTEPAEETTTSETVETTAETTTEATTTTTTAVSTTTAAPVTTESTTKEAEQNPSGVLWTEEDIEFAHRIADVLLSYNYEIDITDKSPDTLRKINLLLYQLYGENLEPDSWYDDGMGMGRVPLHKVDKIEKLVREYLISDFEIDEYDYKSSFMWNADNQMLELDFLPLNADTCILDESVKGNNYRITMAASGCWGQGGAPLYLTNTYDKAEGWRTDYLAFYGFSNMTDLYSHLLLGPYESEYDNNRLSNYEITLHKLPNGNVAPLRCEMIELIEHLTNI